MTRVFKVGVALLMAGSMWYYVAAVLIPYQEKEAALHHIPRGNLSDLYPRWLGARELLLHRRDPYSAAVTREIQIGYYGKVLDGSQPNLPRDQQRFAYPVYVVFLLAPTIKVPFPILRVCFRLLLVGLTVATVPLWIRGLGLRAERTTTATIVVLLLGSFPVIQGLHLDQLTLLVCFLIAAACATLATGKLMPAGILLAVATIKPQIALPVAAWFGLWALSDWQRRRGFVWGFASTMSVLLAGAHCVLPGWLGRWWTAIHAYFGYAGARSLLEVLLGRYGGLLTGTALAVTVGVTCWLGRREPAGSHAFNVCLLSVLAADLLVKPKFPLYDGVILLPVLFWLWTGWRAINNRSRLARFLCWTTALLVGWQWIGGLALTVVSLLHSSATAQSAWKLPLVALFFLPLGSAGLVGLLAVDLWKGRAVSLAAGGGTVLSPRSTAEETPALTLAANGGFSQ